MTTTAILRSIHSRATGVNRSFVGWLATAMDCGRITPDEAETAALAIDADPRGALVALRQDAGAVGTMARDAFRVVGAL